MVIEAFRQSDRDHEKQAAAAKILTDDDLLSLPYPFVVEAFRQSNQNDVKRKAALRFIGDSRWYTRFNFIVVIGVLRHFAQAQYLPQKVENTIQTIVRRFAKNQRHIMNAFFFYGLLSVPFVNVPIWDISVQIVLDNWNQMDRRAIRSVLNGLRNTPDRLTSVCRSILEGWEQEVIMPIMIFGSRQPQFGNHVFMSLGHPEVKDVSRSVSEAMLLSDMRGGVNVPKYLLEAAERIVTEGLYPEWGGESDRPGNMDNEAGFTTSY
jgi:hypothetical protein